jgi:hypothetical protein
MTDPIRTLMQLNYITEELDEIQSWIDNARYAARTNQHVQLQLDRQQTEVDAKREFIELAKLDIASRN